MQHQLNNALALLNGKFALRAALMMIILLMVITTAAQDEGAQLRVGHFSADAPAFNLYVNDEAITGEDDAAALFSSMTLPTQYLDLAAGAHTFALTAEGEALDSALVSEQEFTLEAGHRYLLALMGNVSVDDLHFLLIDETAEIAALDVEQSAITIIVNNLTGVPAMDGVVNGEPYFSDLAYGEYVVAQDPTEGSGSLVFADDTPDAVILDVPEAVGGPAHYFAVFVFSGAFSGAMWDGYTALYNGQFEGELNISDGGAINVGDLVSVEFAGLGSRVQYTLTLDAPAVLDIVQSAEIGSGLDAFVRLYDAAGNLLYENDELSMEDNGDGNFDGGWTGLELEAGTYIVEAATFTDTGVGTFTLSVSASS